jgi:hypothetical protein
MGEERGDESTWVGNGSNGLFERVGVFKERVNGPQGMRDVFDEPGTSEWKTLIII